MNNKPPKTTLREAAEVALYVLERLGHNPVDLRNALAEQAEQEPVAIAIVTKTKTDANYITNIDLSIAEAGYKLPSGEHRLYAAHVRTKDLTDVEIEKVWRKHGGYMVMPIDFARAVIQEYRRKNGIV